MQERLQSPRCDRLMVVSADGHIVMPEHLIEQYLDPSQRGLMSDYERDAERFRREFTFFNFTPDALDVMDHGYKVRSGGDIPWDYHRRLAEMDAEGIAAEVLLPGDLSALVPFFEHSSGPYPPDVRSAGIRAYQRFVADFMFDAGGRLFGVASPGPCLDLDDTCRDLQWAAGHGFRSVALPGFVDDGLLPPLYSPYYDPFWRACSDLGLVLSIHAGHGRPQGKQFEFVARLHELVGDDASPEELQTAYKAGLVSGSPFAPSLVPQQVLWQLFLGGVFDRYPDLKLVLIEVRADWVPATLEQLDALFDLGGTPLRKRPSEYWHGHCFAGTSSIKRSEVRLRDTIGVDRMLFGRDYPHREGTWPNTWDWLRDAFVGVSVDDARLILGENAVRCFDLNRVELDRVAQLVGPTADDLFGADQVDPVLIQNFDLRAGYLRSFEDIDADALRELVDAESRRFAASS